MKKDHEETHNDCHAYIVRRYEYQKMDAREKGLQRRTNRFACVWKIRVKQSGVFTERQKGTHSRKKSRLPFGLAVLGRQKKRKTTYVLQREGEHIQIVRLPTTSCGNARWAPCQRGEGRLDSMCEDQIFPQKSNWAVLREGEKERRNKK